MSSSKTISIYSKIKDMCWKD